MLHHLWDLTKKITNHRSISPILRPFRASNAVERCASPPPCHTRVKLITANSANWENDAKFPERSDGKYNRTPNRLGQGGRPTPEKADFLGEERKILCLSGIRFPNLSSIFSAYFFCHIIQCFFLILLEVSDAHRYQIANSAINCH